MKNKSVIKLELEQLKELPLYARNIRLINKYNMESDNESEIRLKSVTRNKNYDGLDIVHLHFNPISKI